MRSINNIFNRIVTIDDTADTVPMAPVPPPASNRKACERKRNRQRNFMHSTKNRLTRSIWL